MAKLTLSDITSGYVPITTINANWALIETALENTLSRDGTSPNTMSAALDMNSYKIVNLGAPSNNADAARLADLVAGTGGSATAVVATLRSDLSASSGASLVGFIQSGAGAAARTVQIG